MAQRVPPRSLHRTGIVLVILALAGLALPATGTAGAATFAKRPIVTGLHDPVSFAFAPDGRIFYGERFTGKVGIYDPSNGHTQTFATYEVGSDQEQGLLGIALHPDYPAKPFVYVYLTRVLHRGGTTTLQNQILRVRDEGGVAGRTKKLMKNTVGPAHNGGRILFGPDGMLYALIGEKTAPLNAQTLTNVFGKVIRMTPNGGVPADNPFAGDPSKNGYLYDYGHRNGFGLTFDPISGDLWEAEAGPECNDEINRILPGRNYGWGVHATCATPPDAPLNTNQDGPSPVLPKAFFTPTITPDGLIFCQACGLGSGAEGDLFFGAFNDLKIREANLSPNRRQITSITPVFTDNHFIFSMERGLDGTLYFSDSVGIFQLTTV
jgi:glucose/arabinose dehydrogenase